jgi:hypothetical protein
MYTTSTLKLDLNNYNLVGNWWSIDMALGTCI